MTGQVLDYSGSPPTPEAVDKAGYQGVVRYAVPGNRKSITAAEWQDMRAGGLTVTLVYEGGAGQILNGHDQGVIDAEQALRQAHAVGAKPRCIYFACDVDAQPDQYARVDAYLAGAATVVGHGVVGIYGGADVIRHCQAAKSAAWFWQTAAWGSGVVSGIHLYQRIGYVTVGGTQCDVNDTRAADYGQEPAPAKAKPPAPKEWYEMPLDATAKADVRAIVDAALADFLASPHFKNAIVSAASRADLGVVRKEGISGSANVARKAVAAIEAAAATARAELAKLEADMTTEPPVDVEPGPGP